MPSLELRPETIILMEKYRGMVRAFFSETTFKKMDKDMKEKVTIENAPNIEFHKCRTTAIIAMAEEIGINQTSLLETISSYLKGWRKKPRHP